MHRRGPATGHPTERTYSPAWLFAQAILGNDLSDPTERQRRAAAEREQLEWLARISPRHEEELSRLGSQEAAAARDREQLEWLPRVSPEHAVKLTQLRATEALPTEPYLAQEAWDPAKHPRRGGPPNAGWFAGNGGSGTSNDHRLSEKGKTPAQLVAFARPDAAKIWKGSLIAASHQGLPTPILDWNANYGTTIEQGSQPRFRAGQFWGATLELDDFNVSRLGRIGSSGSFDPARDTTALGNVYNEAFHAWFWGNKSTLGWLLPTMRTQPQFGEIVERKAEEAMSETINQVVNELESGQPVLTYEERMRLSPKDQQRDCLRPGHNEPDQTTWGNKSAGSDKEMSEELFYVTIWVLYHGNRRPPAGAGDRLSQTKRFFAAKFHAEWSPQQVEHFARSRYGTK